MLRQQRTLKVFRDANLTFYFVTQNKKVRERNNTGHHIEFTNDGKKENNKFKFGNRRRVPKEIRENRRLLTAYVERMSRSNYATISYAKTESTALCKYREGWFFLRIS